MPSLLPPPPPAVDPDEPGESVHSMPWEALRFESPGPDRRVWYVLAAAVVAFAVGWSAISRLSAGEPTRLTPAAVPTTAAPAPTTTTTLPVVVTEADLRAVDPVAVERQVMAYAEAAAAEYFSGDAGGVWAGVPFELSTATYVERVRAVAVDDSVPGTMRVLVAVSVIDGDADGTFERRPLRGVVIEVDLLSDPLAVTDLPTPAELPFGTFDVPVEPSSPIDPELAGVIGGWHPPFGTVDAATATVRRSPSGGRIVDLVVVDEAGNRWPMSVPLTDDDRIVG